MPQYKNILIALDGQMAEGTMKAVQNAFREVFEKYKDKLQVGRLDFVDSKEEVDRLVNGVDYDVLLITERIRGTNIGAGSIKAWQKKNRLIDIILFVAETKKGGEKVRALHKDGYYNAVYSSDLKHSSVIIDIILNGRDSVAAAQYYGIDVELDEVSANDTDIVESITSNEGIKEQANVVVGVSSQPADMYSHPATGEYASVVHSAPLDEVSLSSQNDINKESDVADAALVEDVDITESVTPGEAVTEALETEVVTNEILVSEETENVSMDSVGHWSTENMTHSSVAEDIEPYEEVLEESYTGYEQHNEVSVLNRKILDASVLGGEPAVMVRARIGSVVSDTVMVIECPNGGLLKNKNIIENRVITLLM